MPENINSAHFNMVQQQIRPWNVQSPRLIEAISNLDRSLFVPKDQQALAFVDIEIALDAHESKMREPKMAARLVQAAHIQACDNVLLIGAGSGYIAALCAKLGYQLRCLDANQSAIDRAKTNCEKAGVTNIDFICSVAAQQHEYDAIILRDTQVFEPAAYFSQLSATGRLVSFVGQGLNIELIRYTKQGTVINQVSLLDTQAAQDVLPASSKNSQDTVKPAFIF